MYDMYPYGQTTNNQDTAPLTLRATREEARAHGWDLDETDSVNANHVAVATRADWEASHRPVSAQVAQKAGDLSLSHS